jgi:hypothetical protein
VTEADVVKFGEVDVRFEYIVPPPTPTAPVDTSETDDTPRPVSIGEFEFRAGTSPEMSNSGPAEEPVELEQEAEAPEIPDSIVKQPSITEAFTRSDNAAPSPIPRPGSTSPQSEIVSIDWNALLDEAEEEKEREDS